MLFKPKPNAYNLRNDKQFIIEKSNKNIKYKSTTHNSIRLWNSADNSLKLSKTLEIFKKKYKQSIINNYT